MPSDLFSFLSSGPGVMGGVVLLMGKVLGCLAFLPTPSLKEGSLDWLE